MTKQKHTKAVSAASKAEELLPLEQMMSQGSAPNEGASHTVDDTHQVTDSEHQGTESEGASLVPKLRFVGFTGSWFICKMDGCICLISGRDLLLSEIESTPSSDQSVPYITGASQIIGGKIAVNRWTARPSVISRHGDLLLTCKGTIGLMVFNAIGDVHIARQIMALRPIGDKLHSVFLKYLETHSIEQILADSRGLIPGIERSSVLSMPCVIPKLAEQQRIGALFKELDHNIELNRGLLDKLTQLKKSMLEQMFPREGESVPRLRFAGFTEPWRVTVLSDIAIAVRGGSPRPIEAFLTDSADGLNWIRIGDATSGSKIITSCREKICREGLSKTRLIPKGSLILSNSMSFGHPYILGIDGCIHDGWLALSDFDQHVNIDYFYYVLTSPWIQQQFTTKAQSSTVKNLDLSRVKSTLLPLPSLDEQQFIGAFLSSFDQRITQQRAKLEKLGQLKKALLEQMFV